jgi:hypothetical protein
MGYAGFLLGIVAFAGWAGGPSVPAGDDDILRQILEAAPTAERARLETLASGISGPDLREKTLGILDDLLKAASLSRRGRALEKEMGELGGQVSWEPGGPAWLRSRVGDPPMKVFDRLVTIDLHDRTNPHFKDYHLNTRVNDEWLEKVAGFPDLRSLDVGNADIRGPGLRFVGTLTALESINLTLTPITDEALPPLASLSKLRVLGLASTKVTGTGLRSLADLPIENLNCHSTPVDDAGLAEISRLKKLLRLEIVHTKFTDEGARHLSALKTLERLQLGSRNATGAGLAGLRELPKLAELDLHDGPPTLEGLRHVGKIATLRVLRVYGGGSGDEGVRALAGLGHLEVLVLESLGMTDAGVPVFSEFGALKRVELHESKITDGALAALRASRPTLDASRK